MIFLSFLFWLHHVHELTNHNISLRIPRIFVWKLFCTFKFSLCVCVCVCVNQHCLLYSFITFISFLWSMHVALALSSLSTLPKVKSSWASGLLIMKWSAGRGWVGEAGEAVSTDTFRYFLNFLHLIPGHYLIILLVPFMKLSFPTKTGQMQLDIYWS